jgi:hypothetical protein
MARPTTAQGIEMEEAETDGLAAVQALDALRVLLLRTIRRPDDLAEAVAIRDALRGIQHRAITRRQRLQTLFETKDHHQ